MRFIFKVFFPLVFIIAGTIAFYVYQQFESFKTSALDSPIASFEIKKGSNIRKVASALNPKTF